MKSTAPFAILDPRAGPGVPVTPYGLSADLAVPDLRITLLSNGFYDATNLLTAVKANLEKHLPAPVITLIDRRDPSSAAELDLIEQIARDSDLAITAMGHCGSCSASATRDAANLARAGVPTCALISEKFLETASFVARAAGMPGVPRVRLPYPVSGTGHERIAQIAEGAIAGILQSWEGDRNRAAA